MKTYLVTGAAGFIGSNFVKYILDKYGDNIEVIILDALTYAGNLASIKEEIERPNVTLSVVTWVTANWFRASCATTTWTIS